METDLNALKNQALRFLARRDHSVYELKMKLRQRQLRFDETAFDDLVEELRNLGYMANENELALRQVNEWRVQGRGRLWIAGKLRSKGLSQVQLTDDEEELKAAQIRAQKILAGRSVRILKQAEKGRLARSLTGRGFSTAIIATILKGDR